MVGQDDALFGDAAWRPALEKYAAVTGLTVVVYGVRVSRLFPGVGGRAARA
jgi:hypothetical protein